MGLALGVILTIILLSPGAVFRISYLESDSLQYSVNTSVVGELLYVFLSSLLLHLLGIFILIRIISLDPSSLEAILNSIGVVLLSSDSNIEDVKTDHELFSYFTTLFTGYIIGLIVIGSGLGNLFRRLILWSNLDLLLPFLKVSNHWYYLLSGREIKYRTGREFDLIQVDVLAESQHGDIIYSGILSDYFLKKDSLDKLYLSYVFKRKMDDEIPSDAAGEVGKGQKKKENKQKDPDRDIEYRRMKNYMDQFDNRFFKIHGQYLVIPFSRIKNINVSYVVIEEGKQALELG